MFEYFYAWTPLLIVGTVLFLALPWLGPVALLFGVLVALLALTALVWAIVVVPFRLGQAISRRWHGRGAVSPKRAAVLTPASPRTSAAFSPAKRPHG